MKRLTFKKVDFIKTATKLIECPHLKDASGRLLPEIAVVGRSNVGKSTLMNHLFKRKNLVRTSSVPGKTQALNFFSVDDSLLFVDLPGYGYAKVPLEVRQGFGPMIEGYLKNREQLKLILLLLDIRRKPTLDDQLLMNFALHYRYPLFLVLTKVDKVNRQETIRNTDQIIKTLKACESSFVHYSATANIGRQELLLQIQRAVENS